MRPSLKERLHRQEVTIGSWVTLGHPAIGELMVRAGFDWLVIDMEHSAITLSEAQHLVQVVALAGCAPLVRVSENHPSLIKRVMDTGAHGVIVPMVNSPTEAEAAVQAVRYPPVGMRGVGLGRAQGYGADFETYKNHVEPHSCVLVQIEHVRAVEQIEGILSVPGIDGCMIGPYDLSASLGVPGAFSHPGVQQAMAKTLEAAHRHRVAAGIHVIAPDPAELVARAREGFSFLAFSLDTMFLSEATRTRLQLAREETAAMLTSHVTRS